MEQELICNKCGQTMFLDLDETTTTPFYTCSYCGHIKKTSNVKLSTKRNINYIEIVLRKMCDIVSVSFLDVDFKSRNYRTKTFWSEQQKNIFIKWFINLLKKNKEAQKVIFGKTLNKKDIERKVSLFVNNFGWISEEEFLCLKENKKKEKK